jgi:hypothetical protein
VPNYFVYVTLDNIFSILSVTVCDDKANNALYFDIFKKDPAISD